MLTRLLALSLLAALAFAPGCASNSATITGEKAKALVSAGATLVDVRTPEEFAAGHIEGALNLPVDELEAKLAVLAGKEQSEIVVYCRSGMRSARAAGILKGKGYAKVSDLGPMKAWQ